DKDPNIFANACPSNYHPLGRPKYEYLGRQYPMDDVKLDDEKMKKLKSIAHLLNIQ
ncbi:MAG: glycyl-radical enzyme activator family protein, partial [Clostridium sp.]|nr:glycyl-radical enzyme activator family protein [Clostridium sp.]